MGATYFCDRCKVTTHSEKILNAMRLVELNEDGRSRKTHYAADLCDSCSKQVVDTIATMVQRNWKPVHPEVGTP